jgi:hypothetical protein
MVAVLLARSYWPAHGLLDVAGSPVGRDFLNTWVAAKLTLSGNLMPLFDFGAYQSAITYWFGHMVPAMAWSYPPQLLLLIWPLGYLNYPLALTAWSALTFGLFAWAVVGYAPRGARALPILVLLLAPASLVNFLSGQNGFLTAALLLGGLRLVSSRPIAAGIFFGLLSLKPQLGLMLPFALAVMGAWRTIFAAAVTTLLLVAASILLFGLAAWAAYFAATAQIEHATLGRFTGFFILIMPSIYGALGLLGVAPVYCVMVQFMVAVPVFVAALWAVRKTSDISRRAFIVVSATFLISPYSFNYDMPMLAGVILWRFLDARPLRLWETRIHAAAWLIPVYIVALHLLKLPLAPVVLLGLFAVGVLDVPFQRRPARAAPLPEAAPAA